jgi:hypothetical protein
MSDSNVNNSPDYLPKGQGYPPPPGAGSYPGNRPVGAQDPYYQPPPAYGVQGAYALRPQKPFSTKAIISMVLGGAGILLCPLGALTGPIGAIFGMLGMKESREHEGTHRGRGLALGGLVVSICAFLLSAALIGLIAVFVVFVAEQAEKERGERGQRYEKQRLADIADRDLELIEDKLYLYFIENNRSLLPGGPVVRGHEGGGLFPDDWPSVTEALTVSDLVESYELTNAVAEYSLDVRNATNAKVTCRRAGREMTVDYTDGFRDIPIEDIRD